MVTIRYVSFFWKEARKTHFGREAGMVSVEFCVLRRMQEL
jgi:hypothetical protein